MSIMSESRRINLLNSPELSHNPNVTTRSKAYRKVLGDCKFDSKSMKPASG